MFANDTKVTHERPIRERKKPRKRRPKDASEPVATRPITYAEDWHAEQDRFAFEMSGAALIGYYAKRMTVEITLGEDGNLRAKSPNHEARAAVIAEIREQGLRDRIVEALMHPPTAPVLSPTVERHQPTHEILDFVDGEIRGR